MRRPELPTVTLTWHVCEYKVHKLHQRYILKVRHVPQISLKSVKRVHVTTTKVSLITSVKGKPSVTPSIILAASALMHVVTRKTDLHQTSMVHTERRKCDQTQLLVANFGCIRLT